MVWLTLIVQEREAKAYRPGEGNVLWVIRVKQDGIQGGPRVTCKELVRPRVHHDLNIAKNQRAIAEGIDGDSPAITQINLEMIAR